MKTSIPLHQLRKIIVALEAACSDKELRMREDATLWNLCNEGRAVASVYLMPTNVSVEVEVTQ
jgi:hypothetical protein